MNIDDQIKKAFQEKVTEPHTKLLRETGIRAYGNIARATPVDTGRARANWNISVNTVDASTTESTATPDFDGKAEVALASVDAKDTIYISNNLPYIQRLNDGYSQQAASNFVEKGVMLAKRQAQASIKRGDK